MANDKITYKVYARPRHDRNLLIVEKMVNGKPIYLVTKVLFTFDKNEGLST